MFDFGSCARLAEQAGVSHYKLQFHCPVWWFYDVWAFFPPVENRNEPGRSTRSSQSNRCHDCCGCEAAFQHRHAQIIRDSEEIMEIIKPFFTGLSLFCWLLSSLLVFSTCNSVPLDFHSICQKQDCTEAPKQATALKKNLSFTREKSGCGKGDPPADGQMGKGGVEGAGAEEDAYTVHWLYWWCRAELSRSVVATERDGLDTLVN